MNLPFIKEGIFKPHKNLVEREESSYIYIYIYIERERERERWVQVTSGVTLMELYLFCTVDF